MAFDLSIAPKWKGRYPIMDTAHEGELETMASINQHHYGMEPSKAEEKAWNDYRREQLVEAAAHHLTGMKASHAAGNMEASRKHALMYGLALRQLGHKDLATPPDEVLKASKNTPSEEIGKFKAHKADAYSLAMPGGKEDIPRTERDVKTGSKPTIVPDAAMAKAEHKQVHLPVDHQVGMEVPEGGSNCAKCEYVSEDGKRCANEHFREWNGGPELPKPADRYCCDLFETKKS